MSLKADSLKSNESQTRAIMKEVNSILSSVDDDLKSAHEQGKHGIAVRLPITFAIPYMLNKDAQRVIYYKILSSLLDRDFFVSIVLDENSSIFNITWLSDSEKSDIELQNATLAKHMVKKASQITL